MTTYYTSQKITSQSPGGAEKIEKEGSLDEHSSEGGSRSI